MPTSKKISKVVPRKRVVFLALLAASCVSAAALAENGQQESFLDISQQRLVIDADNSTYVPRGSNVMNNEQQRELYERQGHVPPQSTNTSQQQRPSPYGGVPVERVATNPPQQGGGLNMMAEPLPSPKIVQRPNIPEEVGKRLYPMTPDEIRQVVTDINERQGAAVIPGHIKTTGTASQYDVDMTLGAAPPVVRVEKGLGAMVNFVDAQGSPWPIVSATNFHSEAAIVTQVADHVLSVSANSPYLSGSVGVMLVGLSTPIQFVVIPASDVRDYRVDLRIPQIGPESTPMVVTSNRPNMGSNNINEFLYGATPEGATRLKVTGSGVAQANTRAWQNTDGRLVIRTSANIISPSWIERQSALDGTSVYVLASTPVVRVSVDGGEGSFYIDGLKPKTFTKK